MFLTGPESSPLSGPQTRCSRCSWVSACPALALALVPLPVGLQYPVRLRLLERLERLWNR